MKRQYKLREGGQSKPKTGAAYYIQKRTQDPDYDFIEDPVAPWRDQPSTVRQVRRLDFFGVKYPFQMTKGQAADLIDSIEPTRQQVQWYEQWKAAGEPNIKQWQAERGPSITTRRKQIAWILCRCIFWVLLVSGAGWGGYLALQWLSQYTAEILGTLFVLLLLGCFGSKKKRRKRR